MFSNVQTDLPVFQFVPVASSAVSEHHGKEPSPYFYAHPLQAFIYIDKVQLNLFSPG